MILVLWTYAGWHEGAYVAAEVENRRRNLPLALILGTGAVLLLYLLINAAYAVGLGYEWAAGAPTVATEILGLLPRGFGGEQAMAVLFMVSALGAINGMIFTSSRIYTELGADHRLFAPLGRWNYRWGTPVRSLVVQAVICIVTVAVVGLCFEGSAFGFLVKCTAPVFCVFFFLTGTSLIVLRFKEPGVERPFVAPAYPLTPLLFCAFWGFMLVGSILYAPVEAAVGLGILLAGLPLYLLSQGWRKVEKKDEPQPVCTLIREGKQLTQC
jgi:amino acid transporter